MRSINYFKNRFEFAVNNSGTIKVNQNDVSALNDLINWANGQGQNSQLEDSLLLFWIFSYWSLEIENEKLELLETPKQYLQLTDVVKVMDKLCVLLLPKDEMINYITLSLQTAQLERKIPTDKIIPESTVSEMLNDLLQTVKTQFKPISDLKKYRTVKYDCPELSDGQKQMLDGYRLVNLQSPEHIADILLNATAKPILQKVLNKIQFVR